MKNFGDTPNRAVKALVTGFLATTRKYEYVWDSRYIDAPVLRDENTDADDLCDDETLYYLTDANMNVTCLVNTGGDAVERYVYDPYGKVTILNGANGGTRP